jgi:hypothetical protein
MPHSYYLRTPTVVPIETKDELDSEPVPLPQEIGIRNPQPYFSCTGPSHYSGITEVGANCGKKAILDRSTMTIEDNTKYNMEKQTASSSRNIRASVSLP